MKPDAQQLKVLQDYLHETLTYREAYEEIYDHILTALEHQADTISYQDAINNIIANDFGSPKNLLKVEKGIKDGLVDDAVRKYMSYFTAYFKFPALLYTLPCTLLTYYFLTQAKFSPLVINSLFAAIIVTPGIIYLMRLYNTGYMLDTTRKSAKDKLFETLAGIPVRVFVILMVLGVMHVYKIWDTAEYYSVTVLLLLGVLYNVSLYKCYKDEFKIVKS
ncbi:hypothetical protein [Mucilaginibacter sp.]|jgi:hypothetical protein|uniref:hypothetical protein n=1 Tax=Mucilaginibacter sp. TaxID=1882438 RepID=UPI00356A8E97